MAEDEYAATVAVTTRGGVRIVRPEGDLDDESSPVVERALADAVAGDAVRTVVDLSRTRFADSSALHALLEAQRAHAAAGRELVLAGPFSTAVRRLFEVTGTESLIRMSDDLESALTC
ncbi:STAS domain-containing protein [Streptomyces sp. NPDC101733]|uniref:STAS domain-containing protein n=1 Tax=unclassified Streptomyces TaxID=2593676 RepID=UPI00382A8868